MFEHITKHYKHARIYEKTTTACQRKNNKTEQTKNKKKLKKEFARNIEDPISHRGVGSRCRWCFFWICERKLKRRKGVKNFNVTHAAENGLSSETGSTFSRFDLIILTIPGFACIQIGSNSGDKGKKEIKFI